MKTEKGNAFDQVEPVLAEDMTPLSELELAAIGGGIGDTII